MKKKYIQPVSETIKMNCEQMIAASGLSNGNSNVVNPDNGSYDGSFQSQKKHSSPIWKN